MDAQNNAGPGPADGAELKNENPLFGPFSTGRKLYIYL